MIGLQLENQHPKISRGERVTTDKRISFAIAGFASGCILALQRGLTIAFSKVL